MASVLPGACKKTIDAQRHLTQRGKFSIYILARKQKEKLRSRRSFTTSLIKPANEKTYFQRSSSDIPSTGQQPQIYILPNPNNSDSGSDSNSYNSRKPSRDNWIWYGIVIGFLAYPLSDILLRPVLSQTSIGLPEKYRSRYQTWGELWDDMERYKYEGGLNAWRAMAESPLQQANEQQMWIGYDAVPSPNRSLQDGERDQEQDEEQDEQGRYPQPDSPPPIFEPNGLEVFDQQQQQNQKNNTLQLGDNGSYHTQSPVLMLPAPAAAYVASLERNLLQLKLDKVNIQLEASQREDQTAQLLLKANERQLNFHKLLIDLITDDGYVDRVSTTKHESKGASNKTSNNEHKDERKGENAAQRPTIILDDALLASNPPPLQTVASNPSHPTRTTSLAQHTTLLRLLDSQSKTRALILGINTPFYHIATSQTSNPNHDPHNPSRTASQPLKKSTPWPGDCYDLDSYLLSLAESLDRKGLVSKQGIALYLYSDRGIVDVDLNAGERWVTRYKTGELEDFGTGRTKGKGERDEWPVGVLRRVGEGDDVVKREGWGWMGVDGTVKNLDKSSEQDDAGEGGGDRNGDDDGSDRRVE